MPQAHVVPGHPLFCVGDGFVCGTPAVHPFDAGGRNAGGNSSTDSKVPTRMPSSSRVRARRRSIPAAVAALAVILVPSLAAVPATAAEPASIVVNEVETAADWIELTNTGAESIDISGLQIKDNDDTHIAVVPAGTTLAAGAFYAVDTNVGADGFGLGAADSARVFAADGTTMLDTHSWTAHPSPSYGRCPDGTGAFVTTVAASKGAPNVCTLDAADAIVINEIESDDGTPGDWVELVNTATATADLSGLRVLDSDDTHVYTIPAGTTLAGSARLVIEGAQLGFGLGGDDAVRLTDAAGTSIDSFSWTTHAPDTTYGRCPDGVGAFDVTAASTKGGANECTPPVASASIVVNEVESNGDDTDWVEVFNVGAAPVDLSGALFRDNDATRMPWALPAGSVVAPGGFFVIDQASGSNPAGFDFGLGNADEVHLFLPDGVTEIATYSWSIHSAMSYGRCPDGTGDFATTTVSTKGAPNNCALPVVINEVESQPESGEDWVELVNIGSAAVDASGLVIRDSEDSHSYALPAGTTIAPGALLVADALGFGLGGADAVRVFTADGTTVLDSYAWTSHAAHTYGRCPDPRGDFAATTGATKGTQNLCAGVVIDEAWPGGADVRVLDDEATFAGDLSGLDWETSGSAALGTLWAVQNGDGLLYKLVADGSGGWAPATGGWAAGRTLHYPDGTGTVDAEGVTVAGDDSAGGVFVSSERNNDASSVSRPAVLRYDVSGSGASLAATREWNLASDLPGLAANSGLEGITWAPDASLTAGGFIDAVTGSAYDPPDYPGHGGGLFFVGVEGTASVYAYALMADGTFARVSTIATTFALVADVQWDADRGGLWVACDEACDGRIAFYELDPDAGVFAATHVFERPAGAANYANEGFAVADDAVCVDGAKPTFYADDADTDGFSLRSGTLPCETTGEPTPTPTSTPTPSPTPSSTPTPTAPSAGAPGPVGDDELTDATRGSVDAPGSAAAGETLTVYVGTQYAGDTVWVWLHSTPISLGSQVVAADGTVTVTLPAGVDPGMHRLVVLDAAGNVIGWTEITVTDGLAATGVDSRAVVGTAGAGIALLVAGAAFMVLRRRATRA